MPDTSASSRLNDILAAGNTAVITGAASGIGLAAARKLAARGLNVVMADRQSDQLQAAAADVAAKSPHGSAAVLAQPTDVAAPDDLVRLADRTIDTYGAVSLLMNNAGIGDNPGKAVGEPGCLANADRDQFLGRGPRRRGLRADDARAGAPASSSTPDPSRASPRRPGNLAYNVSKAASEDLYRGAGARAAQHARRKVSAHLLIPGFTFTGLTTGATEKPAGAWTGQQVVDFMLESLARGDFYILCPDNEVKRPTDEKRMAWAIGDIIENRPALSRWHPDYKAPSRHS